MCRLPRRYTPAGIVRSIEWAQVSGFAAAAAQALYRLEEEDERWEEEWKHLQALQAYQIRQLIELTLFGEGDQPDQARDRRVKHFVAWAARAPAVAAMQNLIDEKLPRCVAPSPGQLIQAQVRAQ